MLRAACSASTATHRAVRWQGLQVLRDVLESFAETPDPDFGEARLLEQFAHVAGFVLQPGIGDGLAECAWNRRKITRKQRGCVVA